MKRVTLAMIVKALGGKIKRSDDFLMNGETHVTINGKRRTISREYNPETSRYWFKDSKGGDEQGWSPAGEFPATAIQTAFGIDCTTIEAELRNRA